MPEPDVIIRLCLLLLARWADVYTTWLYTPDLSREANPHVRTLGWGCWIAANVVLCLIVSGLGWPACWLVVVFSAVCAGWNLNNYLKRK